MITANIEKIISKLLFCRNSIVFSLFVIFITQVCLLFVGYERGFVAECFRWWYNEKARVFSRAFHFNNKEVIPLQLGKQLGYHQLNRW